MQKLTYHVMGRMCVTHGWYVVDSCRTAHELKETLDKYTKTYRYITVMCYLTTEADKIITELKVKK